MEARFRGLQRQRFETSCTYWWMHLRFHESGHCSSPLRIRYSASIARFTPIKGWPDSLELETFALRVEKTHGVDLRGMWRDDLTIGEIFEKSLSHQL